MWDIYLNLNLSSNAKRFLCVGNFIPKWELLFPVEIVIL